MAKRYPAPTKYTMKNPEKYAGDVNNIVLRSSWERKFMIFCDLNPSVLLVLSESVAIPYYSMVDNKTHRYFPDFMIKIQTPRGEIKKLMVEIKPHAQTICPKPKKNSKKYLTEMATYTVNSAKWAAAEKFCEKNGFEFLLMTEEHLKV